MPWTYVQPEVFFPDLDGKGWKIGVTASGHVYTTNPEMDTVYVEKGGEKDPFLKTADRKTLPSTSVKNIENQLYQYEQQMTEVYWSGPKGERWEQGKPIDKNEFLRGLRATSDEALDPVQKKKVESWRNSVANIPKDDDKWLFIQESFKDVEQGLADQATATEEAKAQEQLAAETEAQAKEGREAQIGRLQKGAYERAQKQDLARALGPMALVGGVGSAVQVVSAFRPDLIGDVQDKYVAKELKKKPIGGLPPAQLAFLERTMMAPVKGMATERRKRREAEMAASGQRRSAADLEEARTAEAREVGRAAQVAGAKIADANMRAASEELKRREQMIAYQGQRQRQKLAAAGKGAMQVAGLVGAARAGKATPVMDPTKLAENLQKEGISEQVIDDIVVDVEKAYRFGKPSQARLARILTGYDIDLEELDPAVVALYTGPDWVRRQARRQQTYGQGTGPFTPPESGRYAAEFDKRSDERALRAQAREDQEFPEDSPAGVAQRARSGKAADRLLGEQSSEDYFEGVPEVGARPFTNVTAMSWDVYGKQAGKKYGLSKEQWEGLSPEERLDKLTGMQDEIKEVDISLWPKKDPYETTEHWATGAANKGLQGAVRSAGGRNPKTGAANLDPIQQALQESDINQDVLTGLSPETQALLLKALQNEASSPPAE
jgi:hypothetical protein